MAQRARFIAFEGIDGSGKTTQMYLLAEMLRAKGLTVYETSEPTKGPIGCLIRQMMSRRIEGNHETIAALFVADRLDHLLNSTDGILAKLHQGITVLTDRYYFSSYAYHSVHMDMDWVINANEICARILRPDLNIFLDMEPERCMNRLERTRLHYDLYEDVQNMRKVQENYIKAIKQLETLEQVVTVDADRAGDVISEEIWSSVYPLVFGNSQLPAL
jgi:dTMP kinase